jgi:hypothetical protein
MQVHWVENLGASAYDTTNVIQAVFMPGSGHTRSMLEFAHLVVFDPDVLRGFTESFKKNVCALDVLRSFYFTRARKSVQDQLEESTILLRASYAVSDALYSPTSVTGMLSAAYSPTSSTDPSYSPVRLTDDIFVADIVAPVPTQQQYDDDISVELVHTPGDRIQVTIRKPMRDTNQRDMRQMLSRFGMGRVYYDEDALHRLVPTLVHAAQYGTPLWHRFVHAVNVITVDATTIKEPSVRMIMRLAQDVVCTGVEPIEMKPLGSSHRTYMIRLDTPSAASGSFITSRDCEVESLVKIAEYRLNIHFPAMMRRPVELHIRVDSHSTKYAHLMLRVYVPDDRDHDDEAGSARTRFTVMEYRDLVTTDADEKLTFQLERADRPRKRNKV